MNMKCKRTYQLFDYLEGNLEPGNAELLEMHIKECPDCSESVEIIKNSLSIIEKQKRIKANPFLISRIESRLAERELSRKRLYHRVLQPAFIFSIILISLLGSYFFSGSLFDTTNNVSQEYNGYVVQEPIETALLY